MIRNMYRAVLLDVGFYREVADTPALMSQAVVVVLIANMFGGVGAAVAVGSSPVAGAVAGVLTGLIGWITWSGVSSVVAARVAGDKTDLSELLRVIGFAYAPLTLGIIPWLGLVGAGWSLFAAVIAVRESMECSTRRAALAMGIGWVAWLGVAATINAILGWDLLLPWRITLP